MHIFDMNCMLGPTRTDREPCFRTPEMLLAEMDRLGISEALVHASHGAMGHPSDANAKVVEATRSHPRLHPLLGRAALSRREQGNCPSRRNSWRRCARMAYGRPGFFPEYTFFRCWSEYCGRCLRPSPKREFH